MSNLYSKIHRLKAQGWTWDYFLQQIDLIYPAGIDQKTLYALYRQPHRKANSHISKTILTLHEQCFPSPFPADTQALLAIYNRLIACKQHLGVRQDIDDFLLFLTHDLHFGSPLRRARLNWLKADIHLDQLPLHRNNGQSAELENQQQLALHHYQNCYRLLIEQQSLEPSAQLSPQVSRQVSRQVSQQVLQQVLQQQPCLIDQFTLYKVQQNMLACHLNGLHANHRYQHPKLLDYLKNSDFINASKRVLRTEPYQWIIARNGLRFSSIMKNSADCTVFFQALVTANKAFSDLDYAPLGAPAISKSTEFFWAILQLAK